MYVYHYVYTITRIHKNPIRLHIVIQIGTFIWGAVSFPGFISSAKVIDPVKVVKFKVFELLEFICSASIQTF